MNVIDENEVMEPWEALDIDESDISSFLRPCKRHHHDRSTDSQLKTTDGAGGSQSQPNHQFSPQSSTKTLTSSQSQHHFLQSEPTAPSLRLIPGPAGTVQAAMQRRALGGQGLLSRIEEEPIPTQEFIRRVVENGDELDHDFHTNSWLCALDFLRRGGMIDNDDGEALDTPLNSIKKHLNVERVGQVVAVIKSCTPNGLGGLMLTLKDPTSTIGASVHHKVFTKEEFAKDICVGSVLILQKVALFSPTRSACYLNITLPNIVKVFSKDSGPPSEQIYPAASARRTAPNMASNKNLWMLGDTFSHPQERTEVIMSCLRLNRERADIDREEDKVLGSNHLDNGNRRDQNDVLERTEGIMSSLTSNRERAGIDIQNDKALGSNHLENENSRDQNDPDVERLSERHGKYCKISRPLEVTLVGELDSGKPSKVGERNNPTWICQNNGSSANLVDIYDDGLEIGTKNQNERKADVPIPKSSIPHWTEEQLDELMALD